MRRQGAEIKDKNTLQTAVGMNSSPFRKVAVFI